MKRYLLFAGNDHIPFGAGGGWSEFVKSFDDRAGAIKAGIECQDGSMDWWQVIDLETEQSINADQQEPPHAE